MKTVAGSWTISLYLIISGRKSLEATKIKCNSWGALVARNRGRNGRVYRQNFRCCYCGDAQNYNVLKLGKRWTGWMQSRSKRRADITGISRKLKTCDARDVRARENSNNARRNSLTKQTMTIVFIGIVVYEL